MIELQGTMVDCPSPLQVGVEMIVSLDVYIKASAFSAPNSAGQKSSKKARAFFNEGEETMDEQQLRGRKVALNRMFKVLGLRPQVQGGSSDRRKLSETITAASDSTPHNKGKSSATSQPKTEIVGDNEEVAVEEGDGELNNDQLSMIYKKSVLEPSYNS